MIDVKLTSGEHILVSLEQLTHASNHSPSVDFFHETPQVR